MPPLRSAPWQGEQFCSACLLPDLWRTPLRSLAWSAGGLCCAFWVATGRGVGRGGIELGGAGAGPQLDTMPSPSATAMVNARPGKPRERLRLILASPTSVSASSYGKWAGKWTFRDTSSDT